MDQESTEHMREMSARIEHLETKVDQLIIMFERTAGAWMLLKVLSSVALGIVSLWAFIGNHINFR